MIFKIGCFLAAAFVLNGIAGFINGEGILFLLDGICMGIIAFTSTFTKQRDNAKIARLTKELEDARKQ